jgi:AcrR family transcriptional regulator
MADTLDNATPTRRRRSDARRSIDAILNAARTVLGERPDASMEDIAAAAGVTRQTVYAHFLSRDALVVALIEAARAEGLAAIDAARLDTAPPADALGQFLDISWQLLRRYPLLLDSALNRTPRLDGSDPHLAVTARLEQLIRRGQRTGEFDRTLSASWLVAAILGLGHIAAEQVAAGRLTTSKAAAMLLDSTLRLCGATGARSQAAAAPAADVRADNDIDVARHRKMTDQREELHRHNHE